MSRLLDDLNRPDLTAPAPEYVRDAIRYFRRKPFFFSDIDNTVIPGAANTGGPPTWQASFQYTQGATIQAVASDGNTYVYVQVFFGTPPSFQPTGIPTNESGTGMPTFPPAIYTLPMQGSFPNFQVGQPGTVADNQCLWANAGFLTGPTPPSGAASTIGLWTNLTTVPLWNQLTPPIDYIAPRLVEVTAANLRFELIPITYRELRSYDVIRPAPITVYPCYWAWFQQQIYVWPYPNGFYPITLSYRSAYLLPFAPNDSNYWTTHAERMIRTFARGLMNREYLGNETQAQSDFTEADREFRALKSETNNQQVLTRIPMGSW